MRKRVLRHLLIAAGAHGKNMHARTAALTTNIHNTASHLLMAVFLHLGFVVVALEGHVPISTTAARNWRLLKGFLKYRLQVLSLANTALILEVGGCRGHRRFP
ncbi:hypothetical protein [Pseudomonas syringae]|uniref:hypothetical protein n=1 Tax=Pseudomonas syringae TaxID=317 RepID=UPI0002099183|nr:hypothetical protein [Pseudomonas syringae]MDP5168548.1 hypothetical protein [Pseudomonas syringae pv. aptata str. DSM 50252]